jgi:hypothetical protein
LVFFAHSDLSIEQLKNGRVIFKNFNPDMVDEYNVYKNRFEDLLFEPFKKIKEDVIVESVYELAEIKEMLPKYNKNFNLIH